MAPTPYDWLVARLEPQVQRSGGRLRAVVVLVVASTLLAAPALDRFHNLVRSSSWRVFEMKAAAPLSQPPADPESHAAKSTFRLTVPLAARVLHLAPAGVLALQFLIGFGFLWLALELGLRESGDAVAATFLCAALAFSYPGHAAFVDLYAWFDAWGYFFLLLAMASRGALGAFAWGTLAAWTDERALLALGLVAVWHLALPSGSDATRAPRGGRAAALGVVAAASGYLLLRSLLARAFGLETPSENTGLALLLTQLPYLGLAVWTFLEGLWIPVLAACWAWRDPAARAYLVSGALIAGLLGTAALCVVDMTRSGAYLFPLAFLALRLLRPRVPASFLRATLFAAALVSLLFPDHYLQTGWQQPLPLRLVPAAFR